MSHTAAKINASYYPRGLKHIFEAKLGELKPALKDLCDEEKLLYALERLCKNFLLVLVKEKPNQIKMSTMNLHNFDKAVNEFYEFNQTLDISIEQLYLNRKKLDVTMNKLLDFWLHIDTEQYGFDFPAAADVNKKAVLEHRKTDEVLKPENETKQSNNNLKININEAKDYSNLVINSHRSNAVRKSQSKISNHGVKQLSKSSFNSKNYS